MFRVSGSNVFGTHVIPGLREPGTFRRFLTSRGSFSAATTSSYREINHARRPIGQLNRTHRPFVSQPLVKRERIGFESRRRDVDVLVREHGEHLSRSSSTSAVRCAFADLTTGTELYRRRTKMTRRTNGPPAIPFRILSPIRQANRQASLHIDALLSDLRVSASEGQLLAFVAAREGVPVTAVVRLLGVPNQRSPAVAATGASGLIRRAENPEDARSQLLFVTKKGAHVGMVARDRVKDLEHRLQARVSDADMRALGRVVDAVTAETGINLPGENVSRKGRSRRT